MTKDLVLLEQPAIYVKDVWFVIIYTFWVCLSNTGGDGTGKVTVSSDNALTVEGLVEAKWGTQCSLSVEHRGTLDTSGISDILISSDSTSLTIAGT